MRTVCYPVLAGPVTAHPTAFTIKVARDRFILAACEIVVEHRPRGTEHRFRRNLCEVVLRVQGFRFINLPLPSCSTVSTSHPGLPTAALSRCPCERAIELASWQARRGAGARLSEERRSERTLPGTVRGACDSLSGVREASAEGTAVNPLDRAHWSDWSSKPRRPRRRRPCRHQACLRSSAAV